MNRQPLPPYSGDDAECPKCSNLGAYTAWQPAEKLGGHQLTEEHLRRECKRCNYRWKEALNPPA
ncbi:hypothetical protein AB0B42_00555 [Streptomyces fradiae]|uniref:hypothetical protein n=1 Tax=Streptomyces fradiae TaxID=1906 RepID=UPI0033DD696B